jgi:hypothetical protein
MLAANSQQGSFRIDLTVHPVGPSMGLKSSFIILFSGFPLAEHA